MDLTLHFPCAYPLIKQGFKRAKSTNHLPFQDRLQILLHFCVRCALRRVLQEQQLLAMEESGFKRKFCICLQWGEPRKDLFVARHRLIKEPQIRVNPNQEEIISLLKRIQSSISKGESRGVEEKSHDESSETKPLTKAILDVLEKSKKKTEGDTSVKEEPPKRQVEVPRPQSSFVKRTPISSATGPRGKLPVSSSDKALGEMTKKEEKASLIETMKLAELKEVAKNRGIKGYSKLRKSELLELIRSS